MPVYIYNIYIEQKVKSHKLFYIFPENNTQLLTIFPKFNFKCCVFRKLILQRFHTTYYKAFNDKINAKIFLHL